MVCFKKNKHEILIVFIKTMKCFNKSLLATRFVCNRPFSTFAVMKAEATEIKDYNVREFFLRKLKHDESTGQTFTSEEMKERHD